MKNLTLSAVVLACASLTSACGSDATFGASRVVQAPCPVESMACFHFTGSLSAGGSSLPIEGWSEDLPTPGYANRWHYLVSPEAAQLLAPYLAVNATVSTTDSAAVVWPTGLGGQYWEAVSHFRLEMHPTDQAVAQRCAEFAGLREVRTQPWRVNASNGWVEILIEEPQ